MGGVTFCRTAFCFSAKGAHTPGQSPGRTKRQDKVQNRESTAVSGLLSWYPGAAGIPPGGEVGRGSQEQLLSTLSLRVSMLQAGKGKAEPRINRIQPG